MMLLVGLVGCASSSGKGEKPSGVSEEVYNHGVLVLKIADSYLDGELTAGEVDEKMYELKIVVNKEDGDQEVRDIIKQLWKNMTSTLKTDEDVLESRNELANKLNLGERK